MLEAQIEIDKELAVKGYKRALKNKALREIAYFYASRLTIVWLVVSAANLLVNEENLTNYYLLIFAGLWIISTTHGYLQWQKKLANETQGWSFYASLDDIGVTTNINRNNRYNWDFYTNYIEYDDYLQINDSQGDVTFLPKSAELSEIIEFTKNKIPQK